MFLRLWRLHVARTLGPESDERQKEVHSEKTALSLESDAGNF